MSAESARAEFREALEALVARGETIKVGTAVHIHDLTRSRLHDIAVEVRDEMGHPEANIVWVHDDGAALTYEIPTTALAKPPALALSRPTCGRAGHPAG